MVKTTLDELGQILERHGIRHWGTAKLERPHTLHFYEAWLSQGMHGEMAYLAEHLPKKAEPRALLPRAQTAIVVAIPYVKHPEPAEVWPFQHLPIAKYAQGHDYHFWLKRRLEALAQDLTRVFHDHAFLCMTDSHPVLERDLAVRAGLGWFGKNTCVIHPQEGSFFLLGEIFTSLEFSVRLKPTADHCGTCRRCLDACPTQAFVRPRVLDARKCISYWTIEARQTPPPELRKKVGTWFFGCDICQSVCPWNEKVFGPDLKTHEPRREDLLADVRLVLEMSSSQLNKRLAPTPLSRTGGRGLKRNAILLAVTYGLKEVLPEIECVAHAHPELAELVAWARTELA